MNFLSIKEELHRIGRKEFPGGMDELAKRLEKNYTTLCHEFAGVGSAKLGFETAMRALDLFMVAECPSAPAVLHMVCDMFGGSFAMKAEQREKEAETDHVHIARVASDFGDYIKVNSEAFADGRVTANELGTIQQKTLSLIGDAMAFMAYAQRQHEAGKPAHLKAVA